MRYLELCHTIRLGTSNAHIIGRLAGIVCLKRWVLPTPRTTQFFERLLFLVGQWNKRHVCAFYRIGDPCHCIVITERYLLWIQCRIQPKNGDNASPHVQSTPWWIRRAWFSIIEAGTHVLHKQEYTNKSNGEKRPPSEGALFHMLPFDCD